ncbi:YihY family inner membrane protein [Gammaproteobacteria bacterium]|nr:YihY family inner membrane protein [Gammaproteobacteria bacterium]
MADALMDLYDALRSAAWRFYKEDKTNVAAGLSYSTLLALIPLLTVVFSVLSGTPQFAGLFVSLKQFAFDFLVPAAVDQIADYVEEFIGHAASLTQFGAMFLLVTCSFLLYSIEKALNDVFRVDENRTWLARIVVYWALLTLVPLLFGASLALSSWALLTASDELALAPWLAALFGDVIPVLLVAVAYAVVFVAVPNVRVRITHALVGGVVGALLFDLARGGFTQWLTYFNSYEAIYGALATLPMLLVWIFIAWGITLFAALVVAEIADQTQ